MPKSLKLIIMGIVKEFKEFAIKGNAIDLAVGVIIGGAFGKIVTSIIDDLIMPIVGAIIGKPDFSGLYVVLKEGAAPVPAQATLEAAKATGASVFAYGNFITVAINFLLLALVIFWMIKAINSLKKKEAAAPAAPPAPSNEEVLLGEIRDLLKKK
ncbi:mechanosensitive channel [uncultured Paludibacter sp.]|uniref:Large-conductance mechanosensitive channel n=1 Tax=uncultured Paludibacter sp. TaxID=497635 RepID=A0A653AHE4_9BACT|nr:mechanosensitive channel [uncultured Paludibacter sp.]